MTKTKSLALQCIGIFFAFLFIYWWAGREYRKVHPVKQDDQFPQTEKAFEEINQRYDKLLKNWENKHIKIYQGRWVEDIVKVGDFWSPGYLEVIGK